MNISRILATLLRFREDTRGAFLPILAISLIVVVAFAGVSVDLVNVQQAKQRAQIALDTATLSLQPFIHHQSETAIETQAQAFLRERLGIPPGKDTNAAGISAVISDISINTTEGSLYLKGVLNVPTFFATLLGVHELDVAVVSEAAQMKSFVEVSFVLDNSGSMAEKNRMGYLKDATKCAANILFYGVKDCEDAVSGMNPADHVQIGIVPFTAFVNVGAHNRTAPWMDMEGKSPISRSNFDNDDNPKTPFTGKVNRFALYERIKGVDWEGCVEARPYPHNTDDTAPVPGKPSTLFVPTFWPDEPDEEPANYFFNSYIYDLSPACGDPIIPGTCTCSIWQDGRAPQGSNCSFQPDNGYYPYQEASDNCTCPQAPVYWYSNAYWGDVFYMSCSNGRAGPGYTGGYNGTQYSGPLPSLTHRARQERLCKYDKARYNPRYVSSGVASDKADGPNADCPATSILPLSNDPRAVSSRIDSMVPRGGTNIHFGTVWGYRLLTPSQPFTEGRPGASKVLVIMTDGQNTFNSSDNMNKGAWQTYGYYFNDKNPINRVGKKTKSSADMPVAMNQLTIETCDNIKNAGITVYTVALSPDKPKNGNENPTVVMMRDCATSPEHAYVPMQPSELNGVFKEIAGKLSMLRLKH